MKKNRQYESLTKVVMLTCTVRVWRTEEKFTFGPAPEVVRAVMAARTPIKIRAALERLPRVAAYEIMHFPDNEGVSGGGLLYPDWK